MVRLKQTFPKTVQILVTGPKSLIKNPTLIQAVISHRWVDVLQAQMGLPIKPGDGTFMCTTRYTPSRPKDGWRAEIDEPISKFISQFERHRKQYSARLVNPNDVGYPPKPIQAAPNTKNKEQPVLTVANGRTIAVSRRTAANQNKVQAGQQPRRPNIVISTGPSNSTQKSVSSPKPPIQACRPQTVNRPVQKRPKTPGQTLQETRLSPAKKARVQTQQQKRNGPKINMIQSLKNPALVKTEEPSWDTYWDESESSEAETFGDLDELQNNLQDLNGGVFSSSSSEGEENGNRESGFYEEDDDDNLSLCTAATQENAELRREGIRVEDVKDGAARQMSRFSNAFLLRVKNEIRKLKRNNLWDRNVTRAPLSSYFIQEILKDGTGF